MRHYSLHKFLALLLVAIGSVTVAIAQNVAKIGTTEYATLKAAIDSVKPGAKGYIFILGDASFDDISFTGKQIIINLQTHTVKGNKIDVYGKEGVDTYLKILDSKAKAKSLSVNANNNYSVSYTTSGTLELTGSISAYNGAAIKVESGKVVSTKNSALFAIGDVTGQKDIASSVEITGGYVKAQECCASPQGRGAAVTVNGAAVLESLDNAVVAGNGTNNAAKKLGGTSITIMGKCWLIGRIQTAGYAACGIYHPQQGTLTLKYSSGGIPNIVAVNGAGIVMRGGTLEYSAGNITATGDANFTGKVGDSRVVVGTSGIVYDRDCNYYDVANAKIAISDNSGEKKVVGAKSAIEVVNENNQAVDNVFDIQGGTFSSDVLAYVNTADGRETFEHEGSYYVGKFKAQVEGGLKYETALTAINKAPAGSTVVLLKDCSESGRAPEVTKNVTLDLNGKNLTFSYITASNGGNLTIKDSGTGGTYNGTGANYSVYVKRGGIFNLESGTLTNSSTATGTSNVVVRVEGGTATTPAASTANIKGGKIESKGTPVFVRDPGATVNVSGGDLVGSGLACIAGNGTKGQGGTTINISGGTLTAKPYDDTSAACGIYHPNEGTLKITGGTINVTGGVGVLMRGGQMDMTGGVINALGDISKTGTVGDSRVVVTSSGVIFDRDANYPAVATTKVNISGSSKVNGAKQAIELINENKAADAETAITVTGGTYSSDVSTFCESGKITVPDANGVYSISASKPLMMVYNNSYNEVAAGTDVTINMDDISNIHVTENVSGVNTTLTKTFKYTGWNAFFVPFDFTLTKEMLNDFDFATLYATVLSNGSPVVTFNMANAGDKIDAYFPCLIKAKATGTQTLKVGSVNYKASTEAIPADCSSTKEIYTFYPVMENTYISAKKGYYLDPDKNSFMYNVNAGAYVQPLKFYMTIQDKKTKSYIVPTAGKASVVEFRVIGADEVTGITDVKGAAAMEAGKVYNLQGVVVGDSVENLPKGIYIRNGRKVVVR